MILKQPIQPVLGINIHIANGDFREPGNGILRPGSLQRNIDTMEAQMIAAIPEFTKPLTSTTFALHLVFYCVARPWVVIGCQRVLLLLGRL